VIGLGLRIVAVYLRSNYFQTSLHDMGTERFCMQHLSIF